jgi:hypothetical protein
MNRQASSGTKRKARKAGRAATPGRARIAGKAGTAAKATTAGKVKTPGKVKTAGKVGKAGKSGKAARSSGKAKPARSLRVKGASKAVKADQELLRQIEASAGDQGLVQAVFMLRLAPGRPPAPKRIEKTAKQVLRRVARTIGSAAADFNVFGNLGAFAVRAAPGSFLRWPTNAPRRCLSGRVASASPVSRPARARLADLSDRLRLARREARRDGASVRRDSAFGRKSRS